MAINGVQYDWESVEIQAPNGTLVGVEEISYSDQQEIDPRYGKGSTPRAYGRKNYEASGSMALDRDEFERLRKALGGTVYSRPFPIVVSYANEDQPAVTDTLPDCRITKADTSAKQGEANVGAVKLDFKILSPIQWNGAAAHSAT